MQTENSWMEGLSLLNCNRSKKKLERVKLEQKELLVDFISENPEMITHSSTRDSERLLWEELVTKLNKMGPEKKYDYWKMFWNKWIKGLNEKQENSLTLLDFKLKKFLKNLGFNTVTDEKIPHVTKLTTITEIDEKLKKVREERRINYLEIDNLDYKLVLLKTEMTNTKNELKEKKRLNLSLNQEKNYLIKKRRSLELADKSLDTSTGSNTSF